MHEVWESPDSPGWTLIPDRKPDEAGGIEIDSNIDTTLRSIQAERTFAQQETIDNIKALYDSPSYGEIEPTSEILRRWTCDSAELVIRGVSSAFGLVNRLVPGRTPDA